VCRYYPECEATTRDPPQAACGFAAGIAAHRKSTLSSVRSPKSADPLSTVQLDRFEACSLAQPAVRFFRLGHRPQHGRRRHTTRRDADAALLPLPSEGMNNGTAAVALHVSSGLVSRFQITSALSDPAPAHTGIALSSARSCWPGGLIAVAGGRPKLAAHTPFRIAIGVVLLFLWSVAFFETFVQRACRHPSLGMAGLRL